MLKFVPVEADSGEEAQTDDDEEELNVSTHVPEQPFR